VCPCALVCCCCDLVNEYLELCLSIFGLDTPRPFGINDATNASMLICPVFDNFTSDNTTLRINTGRVQKCIRDNWHFLNERPLTTCGIAQHALDPSGLM